MSFDLAKEISYISKDIKEDEKQLKKLNSVYDQIPKNIIINNEKNDQNSKNNLDSLNNSFNIIEQIDKIKESDNPKDKLHSLKTLFTKTKISNPYLKQLITTSLISEKIIKNIEEILLKINYPMFNGKILMTIFDQLNIDNKEDIELLSLYLEIFAYISIDTYKEFDNYGTINKLILKSKENMENKFDYMEIISDILYKKILITIFDSNTNKNNNIINNENEMKGYMKKLTNREKNILYIYEKLISYLNKSISNTMELFSLIINKENENNKNKLQINKIKAVKYIMNSLFEKIILFLTSDKTPLDISNCSSLLIILLIQKTNEQANEFMKNYQYDSFKNVSLYDFIKYYINDNSTQLKNRQKEFNDNIIIKLKENIINQQDLNTYKTEELTDEITMIIKDIFSIYEIFRTYQILEDLLKPALNDILIILSVKGDSLEDNLFIGNLLYNYLTICSNEFNNYIERIDMYEKSIIDKTSKIFNDMKSKINDIFKDFIDFITNEIQFEKIIKLYNYENLKEGNNIEIINNIFIEENNFWFKIKTILDKIKADRKIYKYIETEVTKIFVENLSKKILNDIEKGGIEGQNLDILIEQTKYFIENNFISDENEISEDNKNNIQKLYSYLDNLFIIKN